MLAVSSLSYRYPGAPGLALDGVSLSVGPGECLAVHGPSGCGKSTLLLTLMGLLREGDLAGEVRHTPARGGPADPPAGLVFQDAETQIFCATVDEEVAFGPENLCVPPAEIGARIRAALEAVGLAAFAGRNVERLSAGQKHRLAIASVLSMQPGVLLLDEPTAQLDAAGTAELVAVLAGLKRRGHAIVVAEHDLAPLDGLADRWLALEGGRAVGLTSARPPAPAPAPTPRRAPPRGAAPVLEAEGLRLAYAGNGEVLRGVELRLVPGERVVLFGENGAGKSSLLACLAGARTPSAGRLRVSGATGRGRIAGPGRVGFLMQNPRRQLFEATVREEVEFSLRRMGLPAPERTRRIGEALALCEIEDLAGRPPLFLSFGEQHRVALASVLATEPAVLLLDEPFAGLDLGQRRRLLAILGRLGEARGTAVLLATHGALPDPGWADRTVVLGGGTLA